MDNISVGNFLELLTDAKIYKIYLKLFCLLLTQSANCCFRLTGRGQKTYMINVETAKIVYKANDSNVKIYLEADSGLHKSSREFDRVS